MQKKSYEILNDHPVNRARMEKRPESGKQPVVLGSRHKAFPDSFEEKFHKKGAMISAVDLLKGIAVGTSMKNIYVEGANGGLDTNYEGKADAALKALLEDNCDFVYVHVEAPDEMGHQGSIERRSKPLNIWIKEWWPGSKDGMDASGEDYRMLYCRITPPPSV